MNRILVLLVVIGMSGCGDDDGAADAATVTDTGGDDANPLDGQVVDQGGTDQSMDDANPADVGAGDSGIVLTRENFCGLFTQARCEADVACCDLRTLDECTAFYADECDDVLAGVGWDDGTLTFDPAGAETALAAMRAGASCPATGSTYLVVNEALRAVAVGSAQSGGCDVEVSPDVLDSSQTYRCDRAAGFDCLIGDTDEFECLMALTEGASCVERACPWGLRCDETSLTCVAKLAVGAVCSQTAHTDCEHGHCLDDNTCGGSSWCGQAIF